MYYTGNAGFLAAACNPNRTIDTKVVLNIGSEVNLSTNDIVSMVLLGLQAAAKKPALPV